MDVNSLLRGVECSCGRTHLCDIEYVYIEKGAIARLAEICEKYRSILIVADENTYSAAGEKTEQALLNKIKERMIFSGKRVLIPNEQSVAAVKEKLDGVDLIIGIGSGVIQDLCKYVSKVTSVPYSVVATAPSMDGYASDGAAMIMGGMKVTYPAGLPRAIVADTEVLKNAPPEMIKAGYGDIIGKFSALNDWKLSHLINGEYFCDYVYGLTYEMIENTLSLADGLLKGDEQSVGALMQALVTVGILMSFAGSSRPASGSEHHLSHYFEIVGILNNKEYFPHGIDVAYSTVITSQIRRKILNSPFPKELFREERASLEKKINRIYTSVARSCIALQDKVGNYAHDRMEKYLALESEIKAILNEVPAPEQIEKMLARVGLDMSEFYRMYEKETVSAAISYAKDLKDRYTVLWLNYDLGNDIWQ